MKFQILELIFDTSLPITFVSVNTCVNFDAREMKRNPHFELPNYLVLHFRSLSKVKQLCPRDFFPFLSLTITDTNTP